MANILTIEDSVETQLILKRLLEDHHQVHACYDLSSARQYLRQHPVNLILLDLMLPDGPGLNIFQEFGTNPSLPQTPIIVLSSVNDLKTRVTSLKSGADDYVMKPFEKQELLARIESVLRRGPTRHSESIITLANVVVDLTKQTAHHKDHNQTMVDLGLTPIELKILVSLIRQYGNEISRDQLKETVWEKTYISKRNVDTHICKLRKKLENTELDIMNKRGKGYYLVSSARDIETVELAPQTENTTELPAFGINKKTSDTLLTH
jgi:DNA-binding response OmpR family regulator